MKIAKAMAMIEQCGGIDGGHHKQWVIDQVARILAASDYPEWVKRMRAGEDGPDTYEWDEGIAPCNDMHNALTRLAEGG